MKKIVQIEIEAPPEWTGKENDYFELYTPDEFVLNSMRTVFDGIRHHTTISTDATVPKVRDDDVGDNGSEGGDLSEMRIQGRVLLASRSLLNVDLMAQEIMSAILSFRDDDVSLEKTMARIWSLVIGIWQELFKIDELAGT